MYHIHMSLESLRSCVISFCHRLTVMCHIYMSLEFAELCVPAMEPEF